MNYVVGLPEPEVFDTICVVVDILSIKWDFIPSDTIMDALGFAQLFVKEMARLHGLRALIVSDRGSQFALTYCGQICNC